MPITTFLNELTTLSISGNATESSYRPAIKTLIETIVPFTQAINEPKHAAYGAPDFLIHQGYTPIGHIEAKDIGVDLHTIITESAKDSPKTANGQQLKRYRAVLPNLLFTNGITWYWFVDGEPRKPPVLLATWDEKRKRYMPTATGPTDLTTLLQQFGTHQSALIGTSHTLARRLALIARWLCDVLCAVFATEPEHGALHQQQEAFRTTLLPTITPAEFADMYAQTIVYVLFAARVALPTKPDFSRYDAARTIPKTNPFLRTLFQEIAGYDLDDRIAWLVDDCAHLLRQTDMTAVLADFGHASIHTDPIIHFYETFLAAYDPKQRELRGVYYTPEPVVSYLVRSIDHLLRTTFHKPLGLADEHTVILDPATGTATFLHAIVRHIYDQLHAMHMADTWEQYVPKYLLPRLHGFELLMAPYTMAHLNLSTLIHQLGYPFHNNERLGIFMTNALDEIQPDQAILPFAQFIVEEGKQARAVKHDQPVMVILGNPPYSGHSANASWKPVKADGREKRVPTFIGKLIQDYYRVDGHPLGERNPKWLQDDYVKFIRFGQWRINRTGEGILAFITNNGYLDNPTFRGMRQHLLKEFQTIYLLNLHGNSKKKERVPDGSADENVFDIQQGVAIGIFVKTKQPTEAATVYYADVWGKRETKYAMLREHDVHTTDWQLLNPVTPWYSFVPQERNLLTEYEEGWKITDMMPVSSVGIVTGQDKSVIAFSQPEAETLSQQHHLPKSTVQPFLFRLFDKRYIVYHASVVTRQRNEVTSHLITGENVCLIFARFSTVGQPFEHIFCSSQSLPARVFLDSACVAHFSPLYLYRNGNTSDMFYGYSNGRGPNFTADFVNYVSHRIQLTFIPDGKGDLQQTVGPEDVFHYLYALLHSPTYRSRYAELLKIDFPRVPITSNPALFATLVAKGAALVDLHLLRIPGSTGVGGAGGATLLVNPAQYGIIQRNMTSRPVEYVIYEPPSPTHQGRVTIAPDCSVEGIAPAVWNMQIGGYQPLSKWLKDRKGRTLDFNDVLHYMRIVVALQETQRLMQDIDAAIPEWPLV